jgi:DNA-binding transcriptional LysR family regulator
MRRTNFDMDALRSFCEGVALGSFAKAADRLGRSTSAISMQMKKLEGQAGTDLLRKSGRGLELTAAGELLLGYARRILDLNDEACAAVTGMHLDGAVRLGLQEDFGEGLLSNVLARFTRSHPDLQIEAVIARNADLIAQLQAGKLDLALAWDTGAELPHVDVLGDFPMRWVGAAAHAPAREPVRLVVLQAPCLMRKVATDALDRAGIPWRIVYTSPSLAGVWAAVAAGLGVTVRTPLGLPGDVRLLDGADGLPALPGIRLALLNAAATPSPACARMGALIREHVVATPDERRAGTESPRTQPKKSPHSAG